MTKSAKETVLDIDDTDVVVSHPEKVYFSKRGETKMDLVDYYLAVSGPIMNTLKDRPLLMERYPDGASGKSWFQKRVPKNTPPWVTTMVVTTPNGTTSDALVAANMAHLIWGVNLGCIGFHVWPIRATDPQIADGIQITDELRIDLDPSPGVGYPEVRQAAVLTRELLAELGIEAYIKTSGSRGLHMYVSLHHRWDGYEVRAAAVALAREMERRYPEQITAQWWKEERGARVFVDFNQNAPHKTVFGAWCVRPRVGAQVSTPIFWDELMTVVPDELTIATVPARVAERGDPWAEFNARPQSLEPLLEMSRHDMADGLMDAPWPPVYPKMPNEPPRVAPSRARHTEDPDPVEASLFDELDTDAKQADRPV